jgi:hypothetical protein
VVMLLRTGGEWKLGLGKAERGLGLLIRSGEPWTLMVNNRGAGVVRPPEERWSIWSRILEFGVVTGQVGQPGYLCMIAQGADGKASSIRFPGTDAHDQVTLAVLQEIHERKVGRYIYPRLKPTTTGDRLIGIVAEWDRTFVPDGTPPPILAAPGFEKQFAAANEVRNG